MMNTSTARQSDLLTIPWQIPIVPEAYPGRNPRLTRREKTLMKQYLKAAGTLSGLHAKRVLDQLARFDQPFVDTIRLVTHAKYIAHARRHLFQYMLQTELAFWAWPKEIWIEAIQTAPRKVQPQGIRLWMTLLAYLFGNFLYVGASTSYVLMADAIFGKERMDMEVSKLYAPLVGIGYDQKLGEHHRFRWLCAFILLANHHPAPEALSASVVVTVYDLLADVEGIGCIRGRRALMQLQRSLCELGILDEPALVEAPDKAPVYLPTLWEKDTTIDPRWLAWVRAFYDQTPGRHEQNRRAICYSLLIAGRWLKKTHPEIAEPEQWTEVLANEYVMYTCQALRGDQALASSMRYASFRRTPQKLSPSSMSHRLKGLRTFFSHLQRQTYIVEGKPRPKLQLPWLPQEALKTPEHIRAGLQPNPRDIAEDAWFIICTRTL